MTLVHLKKALESLKKGYKTQPTELERDGIIQRFEFALKISWITAEKVLNENGIITDSPKNIFRELSKLGWIENPEEWIEFVNARNKTSHEYNENLAQEVFLVIPQFIESAYKLLDVLENNFKYDHTL